MTETLIIVNKGFAADAMRRYLPREGVTVLPWGGALGGSRFDAIFVVPFTSESETEKQAAEAYFHEVIRTKVRSADSPIVIL